MIKYQIGGDVGPLEPWPFDNPLSDYKILSGDPRTSGRMDTGGAGHVTRTGIWRCTVGAFECTEQGDEMMTVLAGVCRITNLTSGEIRDLVAGDTLFIADGSRVIWDVSEDLTKAFFGYKSTGY